MKSVKKERKLSELVIEISNVIPRGKVAYYGQIADILWGKYGREVSAQVVGWALFGLPPEVVENTGWHRIIKKTGEIATMKLGFKGQKQIELLELEGVNCSGDIVDMILFGISTGELVGLLGGNK